MSNCRRIALIGFGEVGQILATDLHARGMHEIVAWDIQFSDPDSIPSRALRSGTVQVATSARNAATGADLVISAVTAAQDFPAAHVAATGLASGAWFLDLNSAAPGTRKEVAALIESRGGRYVEAALMSPVAPLRIATAMLLSGPHAQGFVPIGHELGFTGAQVFSSELGQASAAKMCRSVVVKGMEALLTESLLTARYYGVEQTVLDSLQDLFPGQDWQAKARYMISRSLLHGRRRGEEMREVAHTIETSGIEPWMSTACAKRHDWAATYREAADCERLEDMLDAVLARIGKARGTDGC